MINPPIEQIPPGAYWEFQHESGLENPGKASLGERKAPREGLTEQKETAKNFLFHVLINKASIQLCECLQHLSCYIFNMHELISTLKWKQRPQAAECAHTVVADTRVCITYFLYFFFIIYQALCYLLSSHAPLHLRKLPRRKKINATLSNVVCVHTKQRK